MNELAKVQYTQKAPTLANAAKEFISVFYTDRHASTRRDVQWILEEFEIFVGSRQIDRQLIAKWYEFQDKQGKKANTINKKYRYIKKFLKWCGDVGYMRDPPLAAFIHRRVPPRPLPPIFTDEEYERIKEASKGTHNYFLTVVGRNTGLSMVDVCHLKWASVNLDDLTIQTNRIKLSWRGQNLDLCKIPILANSDLHILLQEIKENPVVRYDNQGTDWVNPDLEFFYRASTHQVVVSYKDLLLSLGITDKTFKNWRNTFVSMLANSGMNLALAMKITGHKKADIFSAYIRPDWDALRSGLQAAMQWQASKKTVKELRKPKGTQ